MQHVVLLCSPSFTLQLADELLQAGWAAWTPRALRKVRAPRRKKTSLKLVPLLPGFVFADPVVKPSHDFPGFSILRVNGKDALVDDTELEPLREAESEDPGKRPRLQALACGTRVAFSLGIGTFFHGTVQKQPTPDTVVVRDDRSGYVFHVPRCLLIVNAVCSASEGDAGAAR